MLALDVDAWIDGGRLVVELAGEADAYTLPLLRQALQHEGAARPLRIAVVCDRLEFADSAALGALIGAYKRALATGGRVALVGCHGPVERMLQITGLHKVLGMHGGLDAAFEWLDEAQRQVAKGPAHAGAA